MSSIQKNVQRCWRDAFLLLSAFGGNGPDFVPALTCRLYRLFRRIRDINQLLFNHNVSLVVGYSHAIRFRFDVVQHMANAQQVLLGNRLDPRIFLHFQHRLVAQQVQIGCVRVCLVFHRLGNLAMLLTNFWRKHGQSIVLDVQLSQTR